MDMDIGYVGITGAASLFEQHGGGPFWPPANDEVTYMTKEVAPSTSYIGGGGGFSRNGPTPTPSEAVAFAEAALADSFCSIPPVDMRRGGDAGSNDPQQRPQRHSVYTFPAASTNSSGDRCRNLVFDEGHNCRRPRKEPRRSIDHGVGNNREERAQQVVGIDGGSAGARIHGGGMPSKRLGGTHALEQELVTTHGMVFPPSRRDFTHLLQDSNRRTGQAMMSNSTNPGALAGVPMNGTTGDPITTAICRRPSPQAVHRPFLPATKTEELHRYTDSKELLGRDQEPPRRQARAAAVEPTILKTTRKHVGNPCQQPGCSRGSTYGAKGGAKRPTHCATHKRHGMVKITSRQCADKLCSTAPSYGFEGKRASFCSKHKVPGMVNVVTPRCQGDGCGSCASYGHEADRRPLFCARHAQDGMVNVVSRKCLRAGCTKNPSYGHPGDRRASFCVDHQLDGMSNIVSPKCLAPGCGKAPSFGKCGDRKASWCKTHKQEGMINLLYSRQLKREE